MASLTRQLASASELELQWAATLCGFLGIKLWSLHFTAESPLQPHLLDSLAEGKPASHPLGSRFSFFSV